MEIKTLIMKYINLLFLLLLTQSCIQKNENNDKIKINSAGKTELLINNDSLKIETIREFYKLYITEKAKDEVNSNYINKLKNKYLTTKLLSNLDKEELLSDPFVNVQDFSIDWLKSIKILKDNTKDNTYIISVNEEIKKSVSLVVIKDVDSYKIDSLDKIQSISDKSNSNEEKISEKDIIGTWKFNCQNNNSAILISDLSDAYLDIYTDNKYARISVEIDEEINFKYSVLTGITGHNTQVNWFDISHDSIICKVKSLNKNSLQFKWFGFYNSNTKKREFLKNPFTNKVETSTILLKKCE